MKYFNFPVPCWRYPPQPLQQGKSHLQQGCWSSAAGTPGQPGPAETIQINIPRQSSLERWESVIYARRGQPSQSPPKSRIYIYIYITVARMHRGWDMSVQDGLADMAICHHITRCVAQPGDIVVGVIGRAQGSFIDDPEDDRAIWPRAYWQVVKALGSSLVVCWALRFVGVSSVFLTTPVTQKGGGGHVCIGSLKAGIWYPRKTESGCRRAGSTHQTLMAGCSLAHASRGGPRVSLTLPSCRPLLLPGFARKVTAAVIALLRAPAPLILSSAAGSYRCHLESRSSILWAWHKPASRS